MSENKQTAPKAPRGRGPMGGGPMGGMGKGEKAKNFKGTMKKLLGYMKQYRIAIVIVIIFAVASTVFSIVGPKILGNVTNSISDDVIRINVYEQVMKNLPAGVKLPPQGITGDMVLNMMPAEMKSKLPADKIDIIKTMDFSKKPSIRFDAIINIVILLIILFLISALFSYIQGYIMTGVSQKITYKFRKDISEKIGRMPLKYFDTKTHGEVLSRVTNDIETISQTLNQSMTQIITALTMLIGIIVMMFSISWLMTIVALLMLPVTFAFIAVILKKSQKQFTGQQAGLGKINGHIEEMYSGHNVMKVFNGEKRSVEEFGKHNKELFGFAWKSQFYSGLIMPILMFISNLSYVAVCVLGGWLAVKNRIKIGDIQAFIVYVRQFNQPIMMTANMANIFQSTAAAAERVFEFLEEEEEVKESENPVKLENVKGKVEFSNVVFGYNEDKTIIKGFNAKINPGQRVAIVGPTGAGKTTMVNLLMRFYDVNSGAIKVDGVDIKDFKRNDLRGMFGMVLQDTWLFNGTVKNNIAYGRLEADDKEVIEAAKAAHVDHFVHTLPGGYEMELNEEASNISQGQKQLLTIARAVLADPPILILDEATSSVDTRTEVLIQKAMENLMKGRTSFIIAHRLSTIRDADLILVMQDGNIVEQGKHEELLKQNGFYASLYNSQFEPEAA